MSQHRTWPCKLAEPSLRILKQLGDLRRSHVAIDLLCTDPRAPSMETSLQDTRFGLRTLSENGGFTAVAVATLALGIPANTTIFRAVNGWMLRPSRIKDPARMARLHRGRSHAQRMIRCARPQRNSTPREGLRFRAARCPESLCRGKQSSFRNQYGNPDVPTTIQLQQRKEEP